MLEVGGLHVSYGRAQVLFGVDLSAPSGSLVCLMGRNGVGKTTLLKAVTGVLAPRSGTVRFDGRDVTRMRTHERVRRGLGYVPQGHETFPQLTVAENLQVAREAAPGARRSATDDALDLFPALGALMKRRAGFLSGGQQQQLAIARALVTEPRMLLLDEPTEGIQPSIVQQIEEAIGRLHASGLTILLVEQYLDLALRLADRFVILDAGEVVRSGDAEQLRDESVRALLAV
ncbi:urea ABC transporter ATP-binding subunit UrtE [Mangrovihabitans endophyticus]|uniref:ABC transporter ATP-binding protein n=1 Tax=Mangrovihabitans endophyticus TaxID=1751298 RepID=A0A8J3BYT1_9ACTN|nr:urea ABC transporter ATP-binding subunit UrtE [Mangrovihabitans endophyticus]GGK85721.1 ABC transporter ATP-binding protein [Mangrovihabitans endophyticus]